MNKLMNFMNLLLLALTVAGFVQRARAYEYPLQFTPNSAYRDLVVAGYRFEGNEVVGNCSYSVMPSSSGKGGGHGVEIQVHEQTCRWDLYGNLLHVTPGAPLAPSPLRVNGTMTVYAANKNGGFTGRDTMIQGGGFVNTPGSHYSWLTPNANTVIPQQQSVYSTVITLKSDGDVPLEITALDASSLRSRAGVESTTCSGQIQPDATCSITVKFDYTKLNSPSALVYDTLRIKLKSDAGAASDFIRSYTIGVPKKVDRD
jgi:hypothetical protein